MSDYGLLQEVRIVQRGSTLTTAASIGDTELVVDYAGDFNYDPDDPDNTGGTLELNGTRAAYTSIIFGEVPDDPDTIVLAAPLTVAADADDFVGAVAGGQVGEDWEAHVTMGEGDQVVALLTIDQRAQWPVGVYDDPVPVIISDDLRHIEDAPGRTAPSRTAFWNTDAATASADDTEVPVSLTFVPVAGSLHVRQNGVDLAPSEWSLSGKHLTVPPSSGVVIRASDLFTTAYDYDSGAQTAVITPAWRDTAPQNLNGFLIPAAAEIGDLLVFIAMMPDTESVTDLNGAELVGTSDYITHTAIGPGTRTYRLEVYAMPNDGSSVPTVSNAAAQDVVCATSAFLSGSSAGGIFDTLSDGTSANAPALNPVSLRVAGTIGNTIDITPGRGDVVLSTNYPEIDIAMTIDNDPTAAPFTASGTAGWCTGSLAVTA